MEDTSGYYKLTEDGWLYARNKVTSPEYELLIKRNGTTNYTPPVDDWMWCNEAPKEYIVWLESIKVPDKLV